jgi:hypothetical protein
MASLASFFDFCRASIRTTLSSMLTFGSGQQHQDVVLGGLLLLLEVVEVPHVIDASLLGVGVLFGHQDVQQLVLQPERSHLEVED